jgi:crossover junction endodeoxyribonuclease RusA
MTNLITLWVPGVPKPQGSKRGFALKGGGVAMVESSKGVKDWRYDIKGFALEAMKGNEMIVDQPVYVYITFVMKRAVGLPKSKPTPPAIKKTGDIDKLVRAVFDSMSGIVYADDCMITQLFTTKRIAGLGEQPGAWIEIGVVHEAE